MELEKKDLHNKLFSFQQSLSNSLENICNSIRLNSEIFVEENNCITMQSAVSNFNSTLEEMIIFTGDLKRKAQNKEETYLTSNENSVNDKKIVENRTVVLEYLLVDISSTVEDMRNHKFYLMSSNSE